jgi:hypothetical protein
VKRIVIEKRPYWEFELAAELFDTKLKSINKSTYELDNDLIVQRKTKINHNELYKFIANSLSTYISFADQFLKCLTELNTAFGAAGVAGNAIEIRLAINHMISICKELIAWEFELSSLEPVMGLMNVKKSLQGSSKLFLREINNLSPQIKQMVADDKMGKTTQAIMLTLDVPEGMKEATKQFANYIIANGITDVAIN